MTKYFVKYIQEYEKQGIHINAITPQNEPTMDTLYASCVWTGEELNIFIRDYLYPALCTAGINNIELWLGTFTDSNAALVIPALEDTSTNKVIDAVCFQWWGSYLAKAVNKGYRKKLYNLRQNVAMEIMTGTMQKNNLTVLKNFLKQEPAVIIYGI